jgi:hypothetical protein
VSKSHFSGLKNEEFFPERKGKIKLVPSSVFFIFFAEF